MRALSGLLLRIGYAGIIGVTVAFTPLFPHVEMGMKQAAPARFCGIGFTETMLANNEPALSYPRAPGQTAAPLGVFALDYSINSPVAFTEDVSQLPSPINVNAFTWYWDFGDGNQATGYTVSHVFTRPGTYNVHVKVRYNQDPPADLSDFDSAQITLVSRIFDHSPTVEALSSARYVQVSHAVTFTVVSAHSYAGGNLTYTWNFGDNTSAGGTKVTHTFYQLGNGFVALIVQDQRGARSYTTLPITIVSQLPIAHLTASSNQIRVGNEILLDASGSTAPTTYPNDRIVSYQWDFGDGTTQTTSSSQTRHTFSHEGTYTITVQAIDRQGIPGVASLVIMVSNTLIVQIALWLSILLIVGSVAYLFYQIALHIPHREKAKPSSDSEAV